MHLVLFRHGLAGDREEFRKTGADDRLRPLTPKGRKKTLKVAARLRDEISNFEIIVSSPLTRAKQTAEILKQVFFDAQLLEAPELAPENRPAAFVQWLKAHAKEARRVLVVGHEPHLGHLASWLLSAQEESFIKFKKSGMACFEMDSLTKVQAGEAELLWLIQPSWI